MYLEMFVTNLLWFLVLFFWNQMFDWLWGFKAKPIVNAIIALSVMAVSIFVFGGGP